MIITSSLGILSDRCKYKISDIVSHIISRKVKGHLLTIRSVDMIMGRMEDMPKMP